MLDMMGAPIHVKTAQRQYCARPCTPLGQARQWRFSCIQVLRLAVRRLFAKRALGYLVRYAMCDRTPSKTDRCTQ